MYHGANVPVANVPLTIAFAAAEVAVGVGVGTGVAVGLGDGDGVDVSTTVRSAVAEGTAVPAAFSVKVGDAMTLPSYATDHDEPVGEPMVMPLAALDVRDGATLTPFASTIDPGPTIVSPAASLAVHEASTVAAVPVSTDAGLSVRTSVAATPFSVTVTALLPVAETSIGTVFCERAVPLPSEACEGLDR